MGCKSQTTLLTPWAPRVASSYTLWPVAMAIRQTEKEGSPNSVGSISQDDSGQPLDIRWLESLPRGVAQGLTKDTGHIAPGIPELQ
jgi:hypothetical protein